VQVGPGDDAAVLEPERGAYDVLTTDAVVEGIHFDRSFVPLDAVGHRALAVNLSDLAAMGARPLGVLIALTLPEVDRSEARALATGIGEGAAAVLCPIVGGDLSAGKVLALTITALGSVARPLSRAGAKVGDRIYVTGTLGGPEAALRAWKAGRQPSDDDRARFACPVPRIDAGMALAARGATSAIDISDGLAADLTHVAAASKVRMEIEVEKVPRMPGISAVDALSSGEEYEIVVTAPSIDVQQFSQEFGLSLTEIGRVVAGRLNAGCSRAYGAARSVWRGPGSTSRTP